MKVVGQVRARLIILFLFGGFGTFNNVASFPQDIIKRMRHQKIKATIYHTIVNLVCFWGVLEMVNKKTSKGLLVPGVLAAAGLINYLLVSRDNEELVNIYKKHIMEEDADYHVRSANLGKKIR